MLRQRKSHRLNELIIQVFFSLVRNPCLELGRDRALLSGAAGRSAEPSPAEDDPGSEGTDQLNAGDACFEVAARFGATAR